MKRTTIEQFLVSYRDVVAEVSQSAMDFDYRSHLRQAEEMLGRWRGGESQAKLVAMLQVELHLYQHEPVGGPEAESIGQALGNLWRLANK
jgi:hypothetical protein